jgi:hypothetical protein
MTAVVVLDPRKSGIFAYRRKHFNIGDRDHFVGSCELARRA